MKQARPVLTESSVLEALAHPVRLDVLNYLMSDGPATASVCARAVGDTPSNCSYHLRVLARHGLVRAGESADGRERPWQTVLTGFRTDEGEPGSQQARSSAALAAASVQLDQRLVRKHLAHRGELAAEWRAADAYSSYTLRATPAEVRELVDRLDALIRPLIAATREDAPAAAELVHVGLHAFPRSHAR
jgi:DNA-binding transcriptional ArsR family regulator